MLDKGEQERPEVAPVGYSCIGADNISYCNPNGISPYGLRPKKYMLGHAGAESTSLETSPPKVRHFVLDSGHGDVPTSFRYEKHQVAELLLSLI